MAEDKLREAERALAADPTDKSAWATYRNAYVHAGNSPSDWLDEIVKQTAAGIKKTLVEGLKDVEKFPTAPYFVFDKSLSILEEYQGHSKKNLGYRLYPFSDYELWVEQVNTKKRTLILTKQGLFYFTSKKVKFYEDNSGTIRSCGDTYCFNPDDFKEYGLAYILNSKKMVQDLLEHSFHKSDIKTSWSDPLLENLARHYNFGAELIKEELLLHISKKTMPQMEIGKQHPALKQVDMYQGHIEQSPSLLITCKDKSRIMVTPEEIIEYEMADLGHELLNGRISRIREDETRKVPCELKKGKPEHIMYANGKEILKKIIKYNSSKKRNGKEKGKKHN